MNTGRKLLADVLAEELDGWKIVTDSRNIDAVLSPGACIVWAHERDKITRSATDFMQEKIELYVLTYLAADAAKLEDTLDDQFFAVIAAIAPHDEFYWETANRVVFDEKYPAWKIDVTCVYQIESGE